MESLPVKMDAKSSGAARVGMVRPVKPAWIRVKAPE